VFGDTYKSGLKVKSTFFMKTKHFIFFFVSLLLFSCQKQQKDYPWIVNVNVENITKPNPYPIQTGYFSVSDTLLVQFAEGNLQYKDSSFRFAPSQLHCCHIRGLNNDNYEDLLSFASSGFRNHYPNNSSLIDTFQIDTIVSTLFHGRNTPDDVTWKPYCDTVKIKEQWIRIDSIIPYYKIDSILYLYTYKIKDSTIILIDKDSAYLNTDTVRISSNPPYKKDTIRIDTVADDVYIDVIVPYVTELNDSSGVKMLYSEISNIDNTQYDWGVRHKINDTYWRTLTIKEWDYLLYRRKNAKQLLGQARIEGLNGLLLLPDSWQGVEGIVFISSPEEASKNIYTIDEWHRMEAAGAIFLPAGGFWQSNEVSFVGLYGYYWSSSLYYVFFAQKGIAQYPIDGEYKTVPSPTCISVRLVR